MKWRSPLLLIVWILVGSCFSARAQMETEISGYVIDFPIYQRLEGQFRGAEDNLYLNLTRIRVRPTLKWGEFTRLSIAYEIAPLYQSSSFSPVEIPDKTSRQIVSLRWQPVRKEHLTVTHFIDRFYFQHEFEFGKLVVGRQRVAWGTGRIWNPTDLFNPINPASFEKIEKDGADLITFQGYLGNFSDVTLVINPRRTLRKTNSGMRLRTNFSGYDFSLIAGYFDEQVILGGDFAGNLWKAGIRGEGILSFRKNGFGKNFTNYILGIDYQFTAEIYALIEYQHNGQGSRNKQAYDIGALFRGDIINLNQEYLYAQVFWKPYALINTGLGYNANLVDGSGFVLLTASFSVTENMEIGIGALITSGSVLSEYWYYADAYFLKGEFYF